MHKEHYKHVRSWNEPENDKKSGVELCPFTAAHYKLKIKEKNKENEQLLKEKKWLKHQILLYQEFHPGLPHDEKMELLEVDMQEALKGE